MRDYDSVAKSLRCCVSDNEPCEHCNCELEECTPKTIMEIAADAIEELDVIVEGYRSRMRLGSPWISVDERLPEKHVEVLICTEDYGKNELGFANTAVWDGSEWIETWNLKESIHYVSHWMPLPEPPKEAEKK